MLISRIKEYEIDDIFPRMESFEEFDEWVEGLRHLFFQASDGEPVQLSFSQDWDHAIVIVKWLSEETEKEKQERLKKEDAIQRRRQTREKNLKEKELKELKRLKKKYEST